MDWPRRDVRTDGTILVGTRVDPLLVVLPWLSSTADKPTMLDQIFSPHAETESERYRYKVLQTKGLDFSRICAVDERFGADRPLLQLDKPRAVSWLQRKARQIVSALEEEQNEIRAQDGAWSGALARGPAFVASGSGSGSAGAASSPVTPPAAPAADVAGLRKGALEILESYVGKEWTEEARKALHWDSTTTTTTTTTVKPAAQPGAFRVGGDAGPMDTLRFMANAGAGETASSGAGSVKKVRNVVVSSLLVTGAFVLACWCLGFSGTRVGSDVFLQRPATTELTAGQKKLARTDTRGMKSMKAFFGKKS